MTPIERLVLESRWRDNHPGEAVCLAGGLLLLAVVLPPIPGALLAGTTALALAIFVAKVPAKPLFLILSLSASFLVPGAAALALSPGTTGGTPLPWGVPLQWTREGVIMAVEASVRSLGASAAMLLLVSTTPVTALVSLGARLRVPHPILEAIWTVYLFIGMSLRLVEEIRLAQIARLGWQGGWSSIRSAGLLAAALLPVLLRRAQLSTLGLELRGGVLALNPAGNHLPPFRLSRLVGSAALLLPLALITLGTAHHWRLS